MVHCRIGSSENLPVAFMTEIKGRCSLPHRQLRNDENVGTAVAIKLWVHCRIGSSEMTKSEENRRPSGKFTAA